MNAHLLRTNQQRMHEAAMNIGNTATQVRKSLGLQPTANELVRTEDFEHLGLQITFMVAFHVDAGDVRFELPHVLAITTADETRGPTPAERINLESMLDDHVTRHHEQYADEALAAAQD